MTADTITAIKKALEGVKMEAWDYRQAHLDDGEWEIFPLRDEQPVIGEWSDLCVCSDQYGEEDEAKANAQYIAAVNPAAITELLSTLESLQRDKDELKIDASNHAADAETVRRYRDDERRRAEAAEAEVNLYREALHIIMPGQDFPMALANNTLRPQALASTGGEHHADK